MNGGKVMLGVSGGVDSRVLLQILPMIGFRNLVVCHLNHNLRGAESLDDSKFVYRLTRRLGFVCQAPATFHGGFGLLNRK